jgi:hypothetical protein
MSWLFDCVTRGSEVSARILPDSEEGASQHNVRIVDFFSYDRPFLYAMFKAPSAGYGKCITAPSAA